MSLPSTKAPQTELRNLAKDIFSNPANYEQYFAKYLEDLRRIKNQINNDAEFVKMLKRALSPFRQHDKMFIMRQFGGFLSKNQLLNPDQISRVVVGPSEELDAALKDLEKGISEVEVLSDLPPRIGGLDEHMSILSDVLMRSPSEYKNPNIQIILQKLAAIHWELSQDPSDPVKSLEYPEKTFLRELSKSIETRQPNDVLLVVDIIKALAITHSKAMLDPPFSSAVKQLLDLHKNNEAFATQLHIAFAEMEPHAFINSVSKEQVMFYIQNNYIRDFAPEINPAITAAQTTAQPAPFTQPRKTVEEGVEEIIQVRVQNLSQIHADLEYSEQQKFQHFVDRTVLAGESTQISGAFPAVVNYVQFGEGLTTGTLWTEAGREAITYKEKMPAVLDSLEKEITSLSKSPNSQVKKFKNDFKKLLLAENYTLANGLLQQLAEDATLDARQKFSALQILTHDPEITGLRLFNFLTTQLTSYFAAVQSILREDVLDASSIRSLFVVNDKFMNFGLESGQLLESAKLILNLKGVERTRIISLAADLVKQASANAHGFYWDPVVFLREWSSSDNSDFTAEQKTAVVANLQERGLLKTSDFTQSIHETRDALLKVLLQAPAGIYSSQYREAASQFAQSSQQLQHAVKSVQGVAPEGGAQLLAPKNMDKVKAWAYVSTTPTLRGQTKLWDALQTINSETDMHTGEVSETQVKALKIAKQMSAHVIKKTEIAENYLKNIVFPLARPDAKINSAVLHNLLFNADKEPLLQVKPVAGVLTQYMRLLEVLTARSTASPNDRQTQQLLIDLLAQPLFNTNKRNSLTLGSALIESQNSLATKYKQLANKILAEYIIQLRQDLDTGRMSAQEAVQSLFKGFKQNAATLYMDTSVSELFTGFLNRVVKMEFYSGQSSFDNLRGFLATIEGSALSAENKQLIMWELIKNALSTANEKRSEQKSEFITWLFSKQAPKFSEQNRADILAYALRNNWVTAENLPAHITKYLGAAVNILMRTVDHYIQLIEDKKKTYRSDKNEYKLFFASSEFTNLKPFLRNLDLITSRLPPVKNKSSSQRSEFEMKSLELARICGAQTLQELTSPKFGQTPVMSSDPFRIIANAFESVKAADDSREEFARAKSHLDYYNEHFSTYNTMLAAAAEVSSAQVIFAYLANRDPNKSDLTPKEVTADKINSFLSALHEVKMYQGLVDKLNNFDHYLSQHSSTETELFEHIIYELKIFTASNIPALIYQPGVSELSLKVLDIIAERNMTPQSRTKWICSLFEHDLVQPEHLSKIESMINQLDKATAQQHMADFKSPLVAHAANEKHLFAQFLKKLGIASTAHYSVNSGREIKLDAAVAAAVEASMQRDARGSVKAKY